MTTEAKHLRSEYVYDAWLANGQSYAATGRALGVDEATVRRHVKKIIAQPAATKTKDHELITLRKQVKRLEELVLTEERVRREIIGLTRAQVDVPDWVQRRPRKADRKHFAGVPTFFASDWHWGERVRPAEIGGVNEYTLEIAHKRAQTFIEVGIELLREHMTAAEYEGVVLALGGDMLSGDIHDELSQTNELESMPALLDLHGVLIACIERLAGEFGRVFVPCVTGNHGRTSRKPRAKRRNHTNFDWLLYHLLAKHFERDKRISFLIPEGPDAYYRIYGTRYLLTHGDQFRGGDGMIGPIGPIFRGDKKKRSRNAEIDRSYDVLLMGHFHQYMHLAQTIVNGSLKGYDEYAYAGNFPYEPAQQALWVTHPDHGITFRMPIFVQRRKRSETADWVSVPAGA